MIGEAPSTSSIAKYGTARDGSLGSGLCVPASNTAAMNGWRSRPSTCASNSKRRMACGVARLGRITLSATSAARLILLRLVHGAHPAVADQTQDSVAADAGAEERGLARALRDRPTCGRRLELARRVVGREELQNFVAEVAIGTARAADEASRSLGSRSSAASSSSRRRLQRSASKGSGPRRVELVPEPHARDSPTPDDRRHRDAQHRSRLVGRQSGEIAQLDEAAELAVHLRERRQRLVEMKQIDGGFVGLVFRVVERDALRSAATLLRGFAPRVVDERRSASRAPASAAKCVRFSTLASDVPASDGPTSFIHASWISAVGWSVWLAAWLRIIRSASACSSL